MGFDDPADQNRRLHGSQAVGTDLLADRYYPPDLEYISDRDYLSSIVETIQMAYLGALFGLLISIPLGWFAVFNVSPSRRFVYPVARLVTMACRSVHEMIWAILFVTILGFGSAFHHRPGSARRGLLGMGADTHRQGQVRPLRP